MEIRVQLSEEFIRTLAESQAIRADKSNAQKRINHLKKDILHYEKFVGSDGIDAQMLTEKLDTMRLELAQLQQQFTH